MSRGINPATMPLVIPPAGNHEQYSSKKLAELLSKPGAPDAETIGKLRERYATMQVSLLTT